MHAFLFISSLRRSTPSKNAMLKSALNLHYLKKMFRINCYCMEQSLD